MIQHSEKSRLRFLDNLRTFVIFLVVCYHAGWVYERSGVLSWVWIVDDPMKNNLAGLLNLILDIFMMPVIFFISGYAAALSLTRKSALQFLAARVKRLMVPWIVAVLTLLPLYKVIYLYSRGLPSEHLSAYFHFTGGIPVNQGWLWFLPVLFLFDLLYLALSKANLPVQGIGLKTAVPAVFLIGFTYSFCMSLYGTYGWTKTVLLDFQNERLLIYFMTFLLGSLCYRTGTFDKTPVGRKPYYLVCAFLWIPINVYVIFLLNLLFNPGNFIVSNTIDIALVWIGFHLSLLGLMYVSISTFRYYLDRGGRLWTRLNNCSFGVYVIHLVVVGGVAALLLKTAVPSLLKYAVLIICAYTASNVLVYLYRRTVHGR